MSSIGSSSTYSVGSSSYGNKGISGLVSGMDTASMVQQMLAGTQTKIDNAKGQQQVLQWKQTMYQDTIAAINSLKSKYFDTSFDASSVGNLSSEDFFNSMISKVSSGSDFLRILSSSSAASTGDMSVVVEQLAAAARVKSSGLPLSSNQVSGKIFPDSFQSKQVTFTIANGGGSSEVKVDLAGVTSQSELLDRLNQSLTGTGVRAGMANNAISFMTDSKNTSISVAGKAWGLDMLGMSNGSLSAPSDNVDAQIMTGTREPNYSTGINFTFNMNGVNKQLSIDPVSNAAGEITQDAIQDAIAKSITDAFGGTYDSTAKKVTGGYVDVGFNADGTFQFSASDPKSSFTVTGSAANVIGIAPGSSNHISTSTTLRDLTGGKSGEVFSFTINGKSFSFKGDDELYSVINQVNNSGAGVRMSYSTLSDTFSMESTSTGSKYGITMSQEKGDLLTKLFGTDVISGGTQASSAELGTSSISGTALEMGTTMNSAVFSLNVNGKDYTFSVSERKVAGITIPYTMSDIIDQVNTQLKGKFNDGSDNPTIQIDKTTGALNITDGSIVKFSQSSVNLSKPDAVKAAKEKDLAFLLGYSVTGKTNVATSDTQLSDLSGWGAAAGSGTVADFAAANGLRFENGRFVVDNQSSDFSLAQSAIAGDPNLAKLFGDTDLAALAATTGAMDPAKVLQGADAKATFTINGVDTEIVRSTNNFTVDGVTLELTKITGTGEKAVINTARDADTIVDRLKSFVKEYNELVDKLTGYTDADSDYRDYKPLSEAQKKEMSDKEIEKWEEKAQTGLLRNDPDIDAFLSQLQIALYTRPSSSKYALYDIGIETGEWDKKGKLNFDETALRTAISNDPESVSNLFSDYENGLGRQLASIMDATAKVSVASPGSLVAKAGMKGSSTEKSNDIYWDLKDIKEKISDLQSKYEKERQKYWNQFNQMEKIMSNYSTQMGWMSSQFGTGG